ncbi:SH3 domain-containing protein [Deltaproteobacteria bacterium]|nr:SH3 domain-containing protein [Deltaproteobacteria bacterium]
MRRIILTSISLVLLFSVSMVLAQDKLWVSSDSAKLKTDKSASSETIDTLSIGIEVTVLASEGKWYNVLDPSGKQGWIYRGKLSDSPPAEEVKKESEDLFAFLPGSNIEADEADSARSIRGLSSETEQYAKNKQTPAAYQEALDRVLAMSIGEVELEEFLKTGKIGEYSE